MIILYNTIIINSFIFFIILIYTLLQKNKNKIWITWIFAYLILLSSILEQLMPPTCRKPTFFTSLYGVFYILYYHYISRWVVYFLDIIKFI